MAGLQECLAAYLAELKRRGASPHTVRNYGSDLQQFASYLMPPGSIGEPTVEALHLPLLREWLASLYDAGLNTVSIRRKVAALRALFRFLRTEGIVETNMAARLRSPKTKQRLPDVMSAEKTNNLIDAVEDGRVVEKPSRERDLAFLELLYGCGIRVSELVGINLTDLDLESGWLRVRGKGNKERQVPVGGRAVAAVRRYLTRVFLWQPSRLFF